MDFGLELLKYWRDDNKTAANDRSDAAGGRELSDLEQRAALESIKGVSTRLYETAATYNAPAANPAKHRKGAA